MKILIVVPQLPLNIENIQGGVHSAVLNLLDGFKVKDENIRVLSITNQVKSEININHSDQIDIYYTPEGPYPYHALNYLLSAPVRLRRHIKDFSPDIIHLQAGNSFLLNKLFIADKTPYLQTIHGMSVEEAKRKKKKTDRIKWYLNGLIQVAMMPKNIIHLSNYSRLKYSTKKIKRNAIIPNALMNEYFNIPLKKHTDNILLYIGVINNNKNILYLLNTLKLLLEKNIHYQLEILGDFNDKEYKKEVHEFIKLNELSKNIRFNGWVCRKDVIKFMERSDILIVSSKHESLPMVIAESMAASKAVAASAVGGISEMIDHNVSGFLYNVEQPAALSAILENLYNNDAEINRIAIKAREKAHQLYHSKSVAEQTLKFYTQCIDGVEIK